MLGRVFQMFTHVDRAWEQSHGGLGIGLHLVKQLVKLHDGSVEARSEGQGRGSEFVVRLPLVTAPADRERGPTETRTSSARRRILVADDNKDAADMLALVLKALGHEVRTAYDGELAVEAAKSFLPDVCLLDIGMPRLDGYGACRKLREQPWGRDVMLVALTGWGTEEDRRRGKEAGFDAHLVKPVEPDALRDLLSEALPSPRKPG